MAMRSIRCSVLGAHVIRIEDLEGNVTEVICAEYEQSNGGCRLKYAALRGGPLSRLLERASDDTLDNRSTLCELRAF